MGKCRHRNVSDKYGETTHDHNGDIVYEVEYRECLDCGEWLSFGPTRDTPATEIELRAAEIAALPDDAADLHPPEFAGWCSNDEVWWNSAYHSFIAASDPHDWDAGYLARCIVEHREAQ